MPLTSVHQGDNANLFKEASALYIPDGAVVADVTYSTGRFWKTTDLSRLKFLASDLVPVPGKLPVLSADFRALPYADGSVDAVILDPPYVHAPGKGLLADRYNGRLTTDLASYADIMRLYEQGMAEAARVLRKGGQLWVKCKDTLASDRQRWSHITLHERALAMGMYSRDLFILVPSSPTVLIPGRWSRQLHARKVHSYLWIFETGGYRRRG